MYRTRPAGRRSAASISYVIRSIHSPKPPRAPIPAPPTEHVEHNNFLVAVELVQRRRPRRLHVIPTKRARAPPRPEPPIQTNLMKHVLAPQIPNLFPFLNLTQTNRALNFPGAALKPPHAELRPITAGNRRHVEFEQRRPRPRLAERLQKEKIPRPFQLRRHENDIKVQMIKRKKKDRAWEAGLISSFSLRPKIPNSTSEEAYAAGSSGGAPSQGQSQRRLWVKDRSNAWWEQCNSPDFPEEEFKKAFRTSIATFDLICEELESVVTKKDTTLRLAIPVRQQVAICVWRLATGEPLREVSKRFGLGISTCHKLVLEVSAAI
nr:putative nuclease HARBI1 [Ipomoea batatas]